MTGHTSARAEVLRRAMTMGTLFVAVASMFSGGYYDSRLAWCFAALAAALTVPRETPATLAVPRETPATLASRAERALASSSGAA